MNDIEAAEFNTLKHNLSMAEYKIEKLEKELKFWKYDIIPDQETEEILNWFTQEGQKHDDEFNYSKFMDGVNKLRVRNRMMSAEILRTKDRDIYLAGYNILKARWEMETGMINQILDGDFQPVSSDYDYMTDLVEKINNLFQDRQKDRQKF